MMTNLFSIFDPSSTLLNLSWLTPVLLVMILPMMMWKLQPLNSKINMTIMNFLKKEVSFSLGKLEKGVIPMIIAIFIMIIISNAFAIFPQNFSITSHISVNLPLALTMWLTILMMGWKNNTNHMLAHLLPQGTPTALMPFMVMIEMTSTLIRPITLCVRLTANLIAGHLLMTLLGNLLTSISTTNLVMIWVAPMILSILESAVSFIQAYVFMTLITMYATEI